ncbi:MAG: acetolactate synthase [Planctomycetota bacterium]
MSSAAIETPTEQGYQPPMNVQFSVFLDNRVGRLLSLLEVFDEVPRCRLAGLSILDSTGHAVVRLLTSRSELARRLLSRFEYPCSEADVLCVELTQGQTMSAMCECLLEAELNLHYAYPLLVRPRGHSVVAVHCDDYTLAGQLLRKRHFTLLAENDLGEHATGSDPLDEGENGDME